MYPQVFGSESLHGPYERFLEQGIGALGHASSRCMQWLKKRNLTSGIAYGYTYYVVFQDLLPVSISMRKTTLAKTIVRATEEYFRTSSVKPLHLFRNHLGKLQKEWGLSPDVCKIFACCSYLDALSDVFCSSLAVIIVSLRVLQWRRRVTQSYRCALTGDVIGAIPMPRVHIVTEAQPL